MAEAMMSAAQGVDPEQVAMEVGSLSNTQRAAVMLMLLGEEEAASAIMASVEDVLTSDAGRTADLGGRADTVACGRAITAGI